MFLKLIGSLTRQVVTQTTSSESMSQQPQSNIQLHQSITHQTCQPLVWTTMSEGQRMPAKETTFSVNKPTTKDKTRAELVTTLSLANAMMPQPQLNQLPQLKYQHHLPHRQISQSMSRLLNKPDKTCTHQAVSQPHQAVTQPNCGRCLLLFIRLNLLEVH